MHKEIKALIQSSHVCVLATVSGGDPHCSLMSYAMDEDCREIYMVTQKSTKKYRNLKKNPSVSLLIDSREVDGSDQKFQAKALTVTGMFLSVADEGRKTEIRTRLLDRHPRLKDFIDHPEAEMIVVKVKAFQLLDGLTDAYFETVE
jgi:nitroimidazol reductase NimA-like FMN-containing flavoprotein (pyridoxamine 5'-phosphate oxidase superfamily)